MESVQLHNLNEFVIKTYFFLIELEKNAKQKNFQEGSQIVGPHCRLLDGSLICHQATVRNMKVSSTGRL